MRRALRKPPRVLARRIVQELAIELERVRGPRRARRLDDTGLLRATNAASFDELCDRIASSPYPAVTTGDAAAEIGDSTRVLAAAERALARRVDLLGSGPYELDRPINWHIDFKTGLDWPLQASRSIDYANLDRPSDVKVPWELSRMQWVLPLGQAYLLTGDEHYALAAREIVDEWIAANPYGIGINWIVAMEAALRVVTMTWLFHAFSASEAWSDPGFRSRLLRTVYLHGDFVERNLERSDINGNHYTANAVGLVFAGLFFGKGKAPARWASLGWRILEEELPQQVPGDGVDFEASTAYHRLVTELFALAAEFRRRVGRTVPAWYDSRVAAMGTFAATYTRDDGTSPLWGDADDARVLPLGGASLGDHRYLSGLARHPFSGPVDEVAWVHGAAAAQGLAGAPPPESRLFPDGGVAVMRSDGDHVFVDCGPVGLAGRGGHGHNDCLSFEASLDGVHLVSDSGSYVYTASPTLRNRFRSTAMHSTPRIDGEEQNRFVPDSLWLLQNDATPHTRSWEQTPNLVCLVGSHDGYGRLPEPVAPVRTLALQPPRHRLVVTDRFEGEGRHLIEIPLQLAPGVTAEIDGPGRVELRANDRVFVLVWADAEDWDLTVGAGWVSPSYGVKREAVRLEWRRDGDLRPLEVSVEPAQF
jgi:uncharacterized heparinase superfamily protein